MKRSVVPALTLKTGPDNFPNPIHFHWVVIVNFTSGITPIPSEYAHVMEATRQNSRTTLQSGMNSTRSKMAFARS